MSTRTVPAGGLDDLLAGVDGTRMAAMVAELAGPAFAGRRAGTPGGAAARGRLGRHLAGLRAAITFDAFPVTGVPEVYAAPTVSWHDGTTDRPLAFGREVAVHLASAEQPLLRRGPLGIAGHDDPAGRWLIVPDGMSLSDAYGHADRAAGLILRHGVDADGWQYTMLAGPHPGPLPLLTVDTATHAALRAAAGRGAGRLAGNAPIRRLDVPAANVHARWRTAAAVVLEAARILAPALPDGAGLAVALLDAEEAGALGSAHHAARLRHDGATPLVINVDGAGQLHRAAAVEAGGPAHRLLAALDQAGRHTGLPLVAGPVASDNRRYAAAGLPAIGIGAGMAGYHSPADTAERVETGTLLAVARLVVTTSWLVATGPATLSSVIGD
jgi:hypothetical protein